MIKAIIVILHLARAARPAWQGRGVKVNFGTIGHDWPGFYILKGEQVRKRSEELERDRANFLNRYSLLFIVVHYC
jgi:hypothetical protein